MKVFKLISVLLCLASMTCKLRHLSSKGHKSSKKLPMGPLKLKIDKKLASRLARQSVTRSLKFLPDDLDPSNINAGTYGVLSGIGGAALVHWDRKKQRKLINDLKHKLSSQNNVLMMRHNEYNQALSGIHEHMTGLSDRLDTLRLEVKQKIQQYEGYVKNQLTSIEFALGLGKDKSRRRP